MANYLDPLSRWLTLLFLISTMMSIGLQATGADLRLALADRRLLVRTLVLNFGLVPLLGLSLVRVGGLEGPVAVALLLLAMSAGGPNALQFTSKVKGGLVYAAALLFVLSFLSAFVTPLLGELLLPADISLRLPVGRLIAGLVVYLLLPLMAGLAVHRRWPRVAGAVARPLAIVGTLAFVGVVLHTLTLKREAMAALSRGDLLAMLALILGSMALGWVAGGPAQETRRVLASTTGMRNAAIALLIALRSYPGEAVAVAVVAGTGLMIPVNMLFTAAANVRSAVASRVQRRAGATRRAGT